MADENSREPGTNPSRTEFRNLRLEFRVDLIADGVAVEDARRHNGSRECGWNLRACEWIIIAERKNAARGRWARAKKLRDPGGPRRGDRFPGSEATPGSRSDLTSRPEKHALLPKLTPLPCP